MAHRHYVEWFRQQELLQVRPHDESIFLHVSLFHPLIALPARLMLIRLPTHFNTRTFGLVSVHRRVSSGC